MINDSSHFRLEIAKTISNFFWMIIIYSNPSCSILKGRQCMVQARSHISGKHQKISLGLWWKLNNGSLNNVSLLFGKSTFLVYDKILLTFLETHSYLNEQHFSEQQSLLCFYSCYVLSWLLIYLILVRILPWLTGP